MRFGFLASYIAIWVLVFFQGLLLLALLRQLAELRRLLEQGGLQADDDHLLMGTSAPEFAGLDVHSGAQVGSQNLSGSGGVILFLSPECTVCEGLADRLGQPAVNGLPPIIALCQGGRQACAGFVKRLGLEIHLVLEGAEEIAARYQVSGFPTAVVIDGKQKIRAFGHPKNVEDLTRLVARSLGVDSITADAAEKPYLASV